MFRWKRPQVEDSSFPRVYSTFQAKDTESDELVNYWIQDLPLERYDEARAFMIHEQYLGEETFAKGKDVMDDPEALEEFSELYQILINEKLSIVCFKEGSDEIVALNVLFVLDTTESDFHLPLKSQPLKEILACGKHIMSLSADFEPKDQFVLEGFGLSVDRKYRKRGIAVKMLEARIELMKAVGLKTTSTIFSAVGSQIAAKRAGYTEYFEVTFADLEKEGHSFRHLTENSAKTMGYQIKNDVL